MTIKELIETLQKYAGDDSRILNKSVKFRDKDGKHRDIDYFVSNQDNTYIILDEEWV